MAGQVGHEPVLVPPGVSVVSTPAGYAAKVIVDPNFMAGSSSGPSTTMWAGNGSNTYSLPWQQRGADTWFHARYLFPDGTNASYPGRFQPMPTAGYAADWDILMEWHSAPGAGYSSVVGIYGRKDGAPARLHLRPVGNNTFHLFVETDRTQTKACNTPNPCGTPLALKYNHWYDISVHIKFSPDPSVGLMEWYVDGNWRFSDNLATMNYASDGLVPGVAFENGLYRSGGSSHVDTLYIQGIRAWRDPVGGRGLARARRPFNGRRDRQVAERVVSSRPPSRRSFRERLPGRPLTGRVVAATMSARRRE